MKVPESENRLDIAFATTEEMVEAGYWDTQVASRALDIPYGTASNRFAQSPRIRSFLVTVGGRPRRVAKASDLIYVDTLLTTGMLRVNGRVPLSEKANAIYQHLVSDEQSAGVAVSHHADKAILEPIINDTYTYTRANASRLVKRLAKKHGITFGSDDASSPS